MKSWPEFDSNGDLPPEIYQATLAEVIARFGKSTPQRRVAAQRLWRIYELATETGHLARFIIFGSFVTAKPNPNDVDVFLLMDDSFDKEEFSGEVADVFEHLETENRGGASVFWIRRLSAVPSEQEILEYWETKRDKSRRGIVEVIRP